MEPQQYPNDDSDHRKWMEALLNSLPNPVLVIDVKTGRVIYANRIATKYLHTTSPTDDIEINAEIVNKTEQRWKSGLVDAEGQHLPHHQLPSSRIVRGEEFQNYEVHWKDEITKQVFTFLASGCVLPPAHGKPSKGVVVFVDVTDRATQKEQLKQAITLREDFLTVAAHELKTPVTSILLQSQSLTQRILQVEPIDNEELIKRLNTISRSAGKLSNLINELLDVSRMSTPKNLNLKPLNFCDVLRDCLMRQDLLAKRQNVQINALIPSTPIRGNWDYSKLEQIITNLISNALKYGAGKPIDIEVKQVNGCVNLSVRDYGIGVSPGDRERIFRRFERAVSVSQYAGMGLGLWLASDAAIAMCGSISVVEPSHGKGSVFVLTLPIDETDDCQGITTK